MNTRSLQAIQEIFLRGFFLFYFPCLPRPDKFSSTFRIDTYPLLAKATLENLSTDVENLVKS